MRFNEVLQPSLVLLERKIPVFLLEKNHFTPFRSEFSRFISFLVGEKLFLPDAVVSGIFGFNQFAIFVEELEYLSDGILMPGIGGFSPSIVLNFKLFP